MTFPAAHGQPRTLPKDHPVSITFFDEAGAISCDRFFAVGALHVPNHTHLFKQVKELRKRHRYHDEFKWATLTSSNADAVKDLIRLLLSGGTHYSCFVADRHVADPVMRFGDAFRAYEKLATQLLIGSVRPHELITVIADHYSAPNNRAFDATVKNECNSRLDRLAVASVLQVDSAATEGLQLVDILTGAVAFSFKASAGLASQKSRKAEVSNFLRAKLGKADFSTGFRADRFRVNIYEHSDWLRRQVAQVASQPGN
ncbi:DUF3800 domain-containing protein [Actinokineospora enzanensis]|uniref:DUF3800 domain-containing protein n=1 Tax=Actinokineospora enzanensis TaxID=155975 RepID=UPI000381D3C0|nr:DUF3800 domain-containing protein [Actinokineospora enzanensis]